MSLPKNKDFNDYDNYITDTNPTTSAQAQDYFRTQAALLKAVIDTEYWQPETNYANGAVVKSDSMPAGTEAICVAVNGGVSSNVEPQWGSVGGANIGDGTCFWHLRYRAVSVNNIEADNKGNITIPVMRASTNIASGADGLVPAPPETSNELFLSNNGEWKEAGKVKSVNGKTGDVVVDILPVGTSIMYSGDTVPDGYLAENGAEVSRTTYAKLFAAIGTKYGVGNGSTTFNLPNRNNGSFPEGSDTAGTVKSAGLPNIAGNTWIRPNNNSMQEIGCFYKGTANNSPALAAYSNNAGGSSVAAVCMNASRSSSIYGNSTTVQPKSVTVKFCIKY